MDKKVGRKTQKEKKKEMKELKAEVQEVGWQYKFKLYFYYNEHCG